MLANCGQQHARFAAIVESVAAEFALTDLAAILGDKVVFLGRFLQIDSEAGDVRGRHQQVLQLAGAPPCKLAGH